MTFQEARERLRRAQSAACLDAYRREVPHDSPSDARGYFLKGLLLEYGAEGIPVDVAAATDCYRRASRLAHDRDVFPLLGMARALMKQGPENHVAALTHIQSASDANHTPEVDLAFARYFEIENQTSSAKKFYFVAAVKGRFAGYFGLASVLRKDGRYVQATVVDALRLLAGPFLFVFLGKTARSSFDGY
jgi:hypothetical protein